MTYHTGDRQYQCTQCGKRFQAQSALTKHTKRHTTTRKFSCNICPKAFVVKSDLKAHLKFVHDKPASSKGIPTAPQKNVPSIDFELNYEHESQSFVGPTTTKKTGEGRKWQKEWYTKEFKVEEHWPEEEITNDDPLGLAKADRQMLVLPTAPQEKEVLSDTERQRIIESQQIEEWMISQGVQLGPVTDSEEVLLPKPSTVTVDDQMPNITPITPTSLTVTPYIPNIPKL